MRSQFGQAQSSLQGCLAPYEGAEQAFESRPHRPRKQARPYGSHTDPHQYTVRSNFSASFPCLGLQFVRETLRAGFCCDHKQERPSAITKQPNTYMNKWNIPKSIELAIISRDTHCIYCGIKFESVPLKRGDKTSWEHIINDAKIVSLENIALCCVSCNASKGSKPLSDWLNSDYCKRKNISKYTVAPVAKNHLLSISQLATLETT